MHGNQFHSSNASTNLNFRIPPDLRARVEVAADRHAKSKADVVREALELYLPILESAEAVPREAP